MRIAIASICGALLLGGLVAALDWVNRKQNAANVETNRTVPDTAAMLLDAITGGKNFCYFKVEQSQVSDLTKPLQWWMHATGNVYDLNYWISPASAQRNSRDPAYMSLDVRKPLHPIIHKGSRAWERASSLGDFTIEFDAKNGHWVEQLSLSITDGKLIQHIVVTRDGEVIHDSTE